MKRVLFALSLLLSFSHSGNTQNTYEFDQLSAIERDFELRLFHNRYASVPSLINQANISKFSYGTINYFQGKGNFRHPQDYKEISGLRLSTASLSPVKETNWTLYGALEYQNSRKEDVEMNLSYGLKNNNSPYYFFQQKEGFWNHQHYDFSVIAANKLSEKLSLGASLDYKTNFYYRKTDTRNETVALTIYGKLSATYFLNPDHTLSLALGMERLKAESDLNNKFPKSNTNLTYNIYLNTGLGSFLKDITNGAEIRQNIPEVRLQWFHYMNESDLSVEVAAESGREQWIDRLINRVEQHDVIAQYNFNRHQLNIFYNKYYDRKRLFANLTANYLTGKGEVWDANLSRFLQNYINRSTTIKASSGLFFEKKTINRIGFGVSYFNREQTDINYGYEYDYNIVQPELDIGFTKSISTKVTLFTDIFAAYRYVPSLNHQPFAATNIFVDWIGNPTAGYLGTNAFNVSHRIGVTINMPDNNLLEIDLNSVYWGVAALPDTVQETVASGDDYLSFDLGLSILF